MPDPSKAPPQPDVDQIVQWHGERMLAYTRRFNDMRQLRDAVNSDLDIPLPELDRNEKPMTANLISTGLDQTAMRVSSTMPDVEYPAMHTSSDLATKKAKARRDANLGWWSMSRLHLKMRQRARFFLGYGSAPALIAPDWKRRTPKWEIYNPLSVLPPPGDDLTPASCIYLSRETLGNLRRDYPVAMAAVSLGQAPSPDTLFDVLYYVDAEVMVTICLGRGTSLEQSVTPTGLMVPSAPWASSRGARYAELDRQPNLAGICPVVIPSRFALDRVQGQFDSQIGTYWTMSKVMALEVIGIQRSVFRDEWVMSREGVPPKIITEADGMRGVRGEIQGGEIKALDLSPGFQTWTLLDRLERNQRIGGGIPSEFGGEACEALDTEILTEAGWRTYDQLTVGDLVFTLDHETGLSEWQPLRKINVLPAEPRTMLHCEGRAHASLTTLNHRWPVEATWDKRRTWTTSAELSSAHRIPIAAMCADLPLDPKWSDALVELVAWYWTEGYGGGRSNAGIAKKKSVYPEHYERIRASLWQIFGPPVDPFPRQGRAPDGVPRWRESKPHLGTEVGGFYLSAGATRVVTEHAPGKEKVPTFEFLRSLTQAQLELFLRVSMFADNCGERKFCQVARARTEAFGFAAILAGDSVTYGTRTRKADRPGFLREEYTTHLVRRRTCRWVNPKENAQRGAATFAQVVYDGGVWCPTTDNGTWLARRNGTVHFTGNSSNIRTGRRGAQVLSAAVDFAIAEAQEVFQAALQEENVRAIAVDKGYFGDEEKSFYFSWNGQKGRGSYIPNLTFESDEQRVAYAMPGLDASGLGINLLQRAGAETLSKRTVMRMDPMVEDPDGEEDQIVRERLQAAFLSGLEQQAATGAIPVSDLARISELVARGSPLYAAVLKAQKEAQMRQASSGGVGAPDGPALPGSPETQPGLSMPGMGVEVPAAIPEAEAGGMNLSSILGSLRKPQLTIAAERSA